VWGRARAAVWVEAPYLVVRHPCRRLPMGIQGPVVEGVSWGRELEAVCSAAVVLPLQHRISNNRRRSRNRPASLVALARWGKVSPSSSSSSSSSSSRDSLAAWRPNRRRKGSSGRVSKMQGALRALGVSRAGCEALTRIPSSRRRDYLGACLVARLVVLLACSSREGGCSAALDNFRGCKGGKRPPLVAVPAGVSLGEERAEVVRVAGCLEVDVVTGPVLVGVSLEEEGLRSGGGGWVGVRAEAACLGAGRDSVAPEARLFLVCIIARVLLCVPHMPSPQLSVNMRFRRPSETLPMR